MKKLLLVLILIAVAISGCTEKGPSVADKSAAELKTLSIASAENLTSFSIKSSMTQTLKLNSGANATTIIENAETVADVNLSSFTAHASGSTKNQMEMPGQPANTSTTSADVYQIGNSTYVTGESGNWTHLADPRPEQEVWGKDRKDDLDLQEVLLACKIPKPHELFHDAGDHRCIGPQYQPDEDVQSVDSTGRNIG